MHSVTLTVHQHSDGHYKAVVTSWQDGDQQRLLLSEESHPLPHVAFSDAFGVAGQMAVECLRALEPSPGLWEAAGAFRSA